MAKIKLKKGIQVGALSAEHDELLSTAFIDLGYIHDLIDGNRPKFLILGRTGSGKTALIEHIKKSVERVSALNPEELAMQYLHSSPVLKTISGWKVNLDVFYKYLWRHVCILELIRMRYGSEDDIPGRLSQIFDISKFINPAKKKAETIARQYLQEYGGDYWIKSDTHIKKIHETLTTKLTEDGGVAASLGLDGVGIKAAMGGQEQAGFERHVEADVVEKTQRIVSDYLIADLNKVVQTLEDCGFNDHKKRYCLVIDDLDTNWMPDDDLYLNLIKSLLLTVLELNRRLKGVKVIIALREDIYYRVFQHAELHEPQREKWDDVTVRLRWEREDLIQLLDRRLELLFRKEYTQVAPTLRDILPTTTRKNKLDAIEYVMERTLMRPRDLIHFINLYLEQSEWASVPTWTNLWKAEIEYSERRLQSVIDEWKDTYFGLPVLYPLLRKVKHRFFLENFSDEDADQILSDNWCDQSVWLMNLQNMFLEGAITHQQVKLELLKALYIVGIMGVKLPNSHKVVYSHDNPVGVGQDIISQNSLHVHKMFWRALGFTGDQNPE